MDRPEAWIAALPESLARDVHRVVEEWERERKVERLWAGDVSLWTGDAEDHWLGWLRSEEHERMQVEAFVALREDVRREGIAQALLIGMGGSSLAPDLFARAFARSEQGVELIVLDSIDPADVRAVQERVDLSRALIIVSSKSGTTLESNILLDYFLDRARHLVGESRAGRHFLAITDPGSPLEERARREGFRTCLLGEPSIGGRYSALSVFGLVPAALMGVDVVRLLDRAAAMIARCRPDVPARENPALVMGAILGVAARQGRDKVTLLLSRAIAPLGAWVEQLLAESTGKEGRGLIPIEGEEIGPPEVYGADRLFVWLRLASERQEEEERALNALRTIGHPVLQLVLSDLYDVGAQFFLWEMATAVAGSILGVNPFDQPDVEASKERTRALMREYEEKREIPRPEPLLCEGEITLFADRRNRQELEERVRERSLLEYVRAHLERVRAGDYMAVLAYVGRESAAREELQAIRHLVRDRYRVATSLGLGPRFLHSTGQAHKGGPNTGVFLHVIAEGTEDRPIPNRPYTLGVVKRAQAYGDFAVLAERERRQLGVHIRGDERRGFSSLRAAIEAALQEAPRL